MFDMEAGHIDSIHKQFFLHLHNELLELYLNIINSNELKQDEKNKIRGWAMAAYVAEYRYADAETGTELGNFTSIPIEVKKSIYFNFACLSFGIYSFFSP